MFAGRYVRQTVRASGFMNHHETRGPHSYPLVPALHSGVHPHCAVDGVDANKRVVTHTMSDDPLILVWLLLFPVGETT